MKIATFRLADEEALRVGVVEGDVVVDAGTDPLSPVRGTRSWPLAEVRLAGARIERTTFRHCNLVGADLRNVRFVDVEVVECLTDGLLLDGATWSGRLHLPGHEVAPAR